MKRMTCEMCGGTDLVKQEGLFVCQFCGTKYTPEEAKKIMIEGPIVIDRSQEAEKHLANARRALQSEDWEAVEKHYRLVTQVVPDSIEAVFFSAYGRAMASLVDRDYYKREDSFNILNKSMSVIGDCYDTTQEDKEKTLLQIDNHIIKMFHIRFVYDTRPNVVGNYNWCINLFNNARGAFVVELTKLVQKHNEAYLQKMLKRYQETIDRENAIKAENKRRHGRKKGFGIGIGVGSGIGWIACMMSLSGHSIGLSIGLFFGFMILGAVFGCLVGGSDD